jgi:olefin beta-lactone synthetase
VSVTPMRRVAPVEVVGRAPPALLDEAKNLAAFLRVHAGRDPERVALRFGDEAITYGDLDEQGGRLGEVLARHGVGRGSRVLILVPVSPILYPLLFGVMAIGACAVIVDPTMRRADLRAALQQARVDAVVGVARAHLLRLLPELWRARPFLVGPAPALVGGGCGVRLDVAADRLPRGQRPLVAVDVEEDALLTFTTGSTGAPKGARRSHRQLNAQGAVIDARYPRRTGDVDLATLPVFATTNLAAGITTVFPSLPAGRVDLDDAAADVVWRQIVDEGVTTFGGSPAFVGAVARAGRRRGVIVPRVRAIALGGAPVSPAVCEEVRRAFPAATVRVVYGATEAEPIASVDSAEVLACQAEHEAGGGFLVGRPDDATTVWLDPIPGVTDPSIGEVCVAGEHVLERYVDDDATVTATLRRDGRRFLRTGDVARRDDLGRLWLLGRRRELVRRQDGSLRFPLAVETIARSRGVTGALVAVDGRAVLAVVGGDVACARARVIDLVDDVVAVDALPLDPRHRARVDRRRLQQQLSRRT